MSKYTKGPWKVIHRDDGLIEAWEVVGPGADEWVADCGIGGNSEDCARLISAAPELLEALKEVNSILKTYGDGMFAGPCAKQIRAAISKAEGTL